MQSPEYTPEEALARETFLALMHGLSYPGRVHTLPGAGKDAYLAIASTLLDLETSYFTPDGHLASELARTGARSLSSELAAYHFYPQLDENGLDTIKTASVGTMLYPDQAATLMIACKFGEGMTLHLTGPGIQDENAVQVNIDPALWQLRDRVSKYPLGWDIFLVDDNQVVGLPRTTQIRVEG